MKKTIGVFNKIAAKIVGQKNLENLLIYSAKSIDTDLLRHAQIQIGASGDSGLDNERLFIKKILPCFLNGDDTPVIFDVGANVGNYSLALRAQFPKATIYAFEPVKKTFEILANNVDGKNIKTHNLGFSDKAGTGKLFNIVNSEDTEIASLYEDVFSGIFQSSAEVTSTEFVMETLDSFCSANHILSVDFLKIDVEGHELFVLRGAEKLIENNGLKIIQFEFNSHNVFSRVFLRDFYLILENFEFYRILESGLAKLGPYTALNEIFVQQNLLAVRRDLCHLIKPSFLSALSA